MSKPSDEEKPHYDGGNAAHDRLQAMMQWTPQARALGLELVRYEDKRVWGRVPYRADLVGDPDTGVIAGGVITTMLDHLSGLAAVLAMREPGATATIDLRIDYMRAAEPGLDILAEASCYKIGRNVAFVRAIAYDRDPADAVAHATSAFMVNSSAQRRFGANLKSRP